MFLLSQYINDKICCWKTNHLHTASLVIWDTIQRHTSLPLYCSKYVYHMPESFLSIKCKWHHPVERTLLGKQVIKQLCPSWSRRSILRNTPRWKLLSEEKEKSWSLWVPPVPEMRLHLLLAWLQTPYSWSDILRIVAQSSLPPRGTSAISMEPERWATDVFQFIISPSKRCFL